MGTNKRTFFFFTIYILSYLLYLALATNRFAVHYNVFFSKKNFLELCDKIFTTQKNEKDKKEDYKQ